MLRLVTNDVRYANIMCCPAVDVALRDLCVERERERDYQDFECYSQPPQAGTTDRCRRCYTFLLRESWEFPAREIVDLRAYYAETLECELQSDW